MRKAPSLLGKDLRIPKKRRPGHTPGAAIVIADIVVKIKHEVTSLQRVRTMEKRDPKRVGELRKEEGHARGSWRLGSWPVQGGEKALVG